MIEPHDYDKLKQEELDEALQQEENELFKMIEPYIDGLNNTVKVFSITSGMSEEECTVYVRETVFNLLKG